jgi:hypothetical protein
MQLHDTVTRQRGTLTTGPYGSADEIDWTTPAEVVYAAEVQPLSSDENVVLQQRVESRWRAFLPPGADVVATDRIVWDTVVYEIDGEPERWKRRAVMHHLELILTKVSGG